MFENIRADYALHHKQRNRSFMFLVIYRYGRWSLERKFPPWRWLTSKIYGVLNKFAQVYIGIFMDRHATVGKGFHLTHPENVRIGSKVVIGDRVGIMQGVTIATNMLPGEPVIGNDVFIGCNATILGNVKIGDGARIGACTLVITDVPPGAIALGVPAKIMRMPATKHPSLRDANGMPGNAPLQKKRLGQPAPSAPEMSKD